MAAMAARDPRLVLARRVITRPDDAGGEDFEGVTPEAFKAQAAEGAFVLHWTAHGMHYAIPQQVLAQLQNGQDVLANLSRAALLRAQDRFARFEVINLTTDPQILAARLLARGRESTDEIAGRLARASFALPDGIVAHDIDNSGPLAQTVQAALDRLYPVSV